VRTTQGGHHQKHAATHTAFRQPLRKPIRKKQFPRQSDSIARIRMGKPGQNSAPSRVLDLASFSLLWRQPPDEPARTQRKWTVSTPRSPGKKIILWNLGAPPGPSVFLAACVAQSGRPFAYKSKLCEQDTPLRNQIQADQRKTGWLE